MLYAAAGAAGTASLLAIDGVRIVAAGVGVLVLAVLGIRALWVAFRVRTGSELPGEVATPRRAFATSVGATASNPATIVSWAAIFAAATGAGSSILGLLAGVGLGSLTWVSLLAVGIALVRRSIGSRGLRIADGLAGVGMLGYAGALGYRTVHDA